MHSVKREYHLGAGHIKIHKSIKLGWEKTSHSIKLEFN